MKNEWSKTLLSVYKYLDRVCEGIDNLVEQKAFNSFYYCQNRSENEVTYVAKKIINLIERKAKLVNMKVLVDNCLLASDETSAQLLIERYIDDDISENIAKRHNINIRTFFRKVSQAESTFTYLLKKQGFDENRLSNYLETEKWIIEIYEKYKNEESEELELV